MIIAAVAAAFAVATAVLSSCSSSPSLVDVEPADMLGADRAAYLQIPVPQNREFTERAVAFLADGASEGDIRRVLSRLDVVAISLGQDGGWELAATGDFPTTLSKLVLTEGNGWKKREAAGVRYYEGSAGMSLSMMTDGSAVAGSSAASVEELLARWSAFQSAAGGKADGTAGPEEPARPEGIVPEEVASFLAAGGGLGETALYEASPDGRIRFFVPSAGRFLAAFVGVPLGVRSVRGSLLQVEGEEAFDSVLGIEFGHPMYALAFGALARGMGGVRVTQGEGGLTVVSGLRVGWDQLLSAVAN